MSKRLNQRKGQLAKAELRRILNLQKLDKSGKYEKKTFKISSPKKINLTKAPISKQKWH